MVITRSFGKAISDVMPMFEKVLSVIIFIPFPVLITKEYTPHKYERSLIQSFFEKWSPDDRIEIQTTMRIMLVKIFLFE